MTASMHDLLAVLPGSRASGVLPSRVEGITADSRAVVPHGMFVALRGERADGHDFAADAVAAGACVLVVERSLTLPVPVPQIVVADTRRAVSRLADAYYGHPSRTLRIAGITGTNGKTTTAHFVQSVCAAGGLPCGIIGTLGAAFGQRVWEIDNTTPLALDLHRILAEMRELGARAIAMEVSSHGLELNRADDVHFTAAVLTNVTHEHLDFHGSFDAYVLAKRKLFELAPLAILNVDDPTGLAFARAFDSVTTYGIERDAEIRATAIHQSIAGTTFTVGRLECEIELAGRFNVSNALAAIGVGRAFGIPDPSIVHGLAATPTVPGRMERVEAGGILAIVDYAHTPDALANVLHAARWATRGRLFVVFGCGGDRDHAKRPEMGRIAHELADRAIVTSDNPRSEDAGAIARAVAGTTGSEIVLDRRTAIHTAVAAAQPGDTVVVAGKGHERVQIVGNDRHPFDDREEVRAALGLRFNGGGSAR